MMKRVASAVMVAAALIGGGMLFSTQSLVAAPEKSLTEKADQILKSHNFAEGIAKSAGSGLFKAKYIPAGYKITDEYDVVLNGFDQSNRPLSSSDVLKAHVVELSPQSKDEQLSAGENIELLTIVSVADKDAKAERVPGTQGKRLETRVHGQPAVVSQLEGSVKSSFVKWTERDGLAIQVNGVNVSSDETLAVAKGLEEL